MPLATIITAIGTIVAPVVGKAIKKRLRGTRGGDALTTATSLMAGGTGGGTGGAFGTPGAPIEIVPGTVYEIDPVTGDVRRKRKRRRRRQLLTCSDRNDIAFIIGVLGKGSIANTAISTLLSRRCS